MSGGVSGLIWAVMLLVVVLVAGVVAIYIAGRWRTWVRESGPDESELLEQFRELYESGQLTAEEFRRVRQRLSRR